LSEGCGPEDGPTVSRRRAIRTVKQAKAIGVLILLGVGLGVAAIGAVLDALSKMFQANSLLCTLLIVAVVLIAGWVLYAKIQRDKVEKRMRVALRAERDALIAEVKVSDDRFDYIISNEDYRRGLPKENLYRKVFFLRLLSLYENRCAKCGGVSNGLDIDHLVLSKNEGGCFILKHKAGYLINNAVPLCQSCNRSKSDRSYRDFYAEDDLLNLFQKNVTMTKLLNEWTPPPNLL